jgi:hypothetical protein
LGYLQHRQTILEQYIDGTIAVNQHSVELNIVDTRIENQRKTPWLRYHNPLVLSAEGDLAVRPRREPQIGDEVVGVGHVQASAGEQLAFSFGLDGHFAPNDGVDAIGWLDILVMGIYVFIIVVLVTLLPYVVRLIGCIRSLLARVDRFENTAIFHGMV